MGRELERSEIQDRLRNAYAQIAPVYGNRRSVEFEPYLEYDIELFADSVKLSGFDVVDLGAGDGHESVLLKQQGLNVTPIDLSPEMVEECQKKGFDNARVMDFYNLDFDNDTFDGVWMAFSLLHVPENDVEEVLAEAQRVTKQFGILHVSLYEGNEGEIFRGSEEESKRLFNYMTSDQLEKYVRKFFTITDLRRINIAPRPTLSLKAINITNSR